MQPTSPLPLLLASQAPAGGSTNPEGAPTALVQRVEERPQSPLAQGSYAWPAWVVIGVALLGAVGALAWWLRLQRRKPAPLRSLAGDSVAQGTRS